jgi:Xaa-Pro dipeptidase
VIRLDAPDLVSARRSRFERAAAKLGVEGWLLTTGRAVRFLTGAVPDSLDLAGEATSPVVAAGGAFIPLATPVSDPLLVDEVVDSIPERGRVAVDRLGFSAMCRLRELRPGIEVVDAARVMAGARGPKSPREIALITEAVHRSELALLATLPGVAAGRTERELSAEFFGHALEQGLEDLHVDTVFAALPRTLGAAPWARGEWLGYHPYRELTGDRVLEDGDQVAFDAGLMLEGYASDVGWTLKVGGEPSRAERALASRWREVAMRVVEAVRPGVSCADLRAAALEGWRKDAPPWPYPLYVVHGVGTEVAEPPFAGAAVRPETEEAMTLEEGQVLLVEPYVWEEGVGGYRAECCVVVEAGGARIVNRVDFGRWPGSSELG